MTIRLLSPLVTNQIAAGEVVERPASVIKELVENSLDAGATRIEIEIAGGGKSLIRIRDNGSGIPRDELALALTRHATSKIVDASDLSSVVSFGFRGEALASAAAVSRLTLISKPADQPEAWKIAVEGVFQEPEILPASHPDGTTVTVCDLFFNVPPRRRFLKSERTEMMHIVTLFKNLALGNNAVAFTLVNSGRAMFTLPAACDEKQREQRIITLLGRNFATGRMTVCMERDGLSLTGFVMPPPREASTDAEVQFLYLNGRPIREKNTMHAIRQAYTEYYGREVKISYVLYLTMDPADVDVNVHPSKHEVRFAEQRKVHDFFVMAVLETLRQSAPPVPGDGSELFGAPMEENSGAGHGYAGGAGHDSFVSGSAPFVSGGMSSPGAVGSFPPSGDSRFAAGALPGGAYSGGGGSCSGSSAGSGGGFRSSAASFLSPDLPDPREHRYSGTPGGSFPGTSPASSRKEAEAGCAWLRDTLGDPALTPDTGSSPVAAGAGSGAVLPVLYGVLDSHGCAGFRGRLYDADLRELDRRRLGRLYTENAPGALLMIPQSVPAGDVPAERREQIRDLGRSLGFELQFSGSAVRILAVPECLRRYDLAAVITVLLERADALGADPDPGNGSGSGSSSASAADPTGKQAPDGEQAPIGSGDQSPETSRKTAAGSDAGSLRLALADAAVSRRNYSLADGAALLSDPQADWDRLSGDPACFRILDTDLILRGSAGA